MLGRQRVALEGGVIVDDGAGDQRAEALPHVALDESRPFGELVARRGAGGQRTEEAGAVPHGDHQAEHARGESLDQATGELLDAGSSIAGCSAAGGGSAMSVVMAVIPSLCGSTLWAGGHRRHRAIYTAERDTAWVVLPIPAAHQAVLVGEGRRRGAGGPPCGPSRCRPAPRPPRPVSRRAARVARAAPSRPRRPSPRRDRRTPPPRR